MKKCISLLTILFWIQFAVCFTVTMTDGVSYQGRYEAKKLDYIYLSDGLMLYKLPINKVVSIKDENYNSISEIINSKDFENIDITHHKYFIYNFEESEKYVSSSSINSNNRISNDNLLKMTDREFEIYELEQKQKQAELVSKKIDRISSTLWSIWGISLGVGLLLFVVS